MAPSAAASAAIALARVRARGPNLRYRPPPMPSSYRPRPLPLLAALAAATLVASAAGAVRADAPVQQGPAPKTAAEAAREQDGGAAPKAVEDRPSEPAPAEASKPGPARPLAAEGRPAGRPPDQAYPDDLPETPIPVPPVLPTGILIAWKPMLLQVRADNGGKPDDIKDQFSSDKLSPLRLLVRYTQLFDEKMPFVGRFEFEGGEFKSDPQATFNGSLGSTGADFTGRIMVGAATRVSPGFTVLGSIGAITRYQYGKANGGVPTMGTFGAVTNMELEFRIHPVVTLSIFGEAALAPIPYYVQPNLGELDDSSEVKGRIQLSFDLTRQSALDIGFDATRWHTTFTKTTILGGTGQALILENRELALTLGLRWVL